MKTMNISKHFTLGPLNQQTKECALHYKTYFYTSWRTNNVSYMYQIQYRRHDFIYIYIYIYTFIYIDIYFCTSKYFKRDK